MKLFLGFGNIIIIIYLIYYLTCDYTRLFPFRLFFFLFYLLRCVVSWLVLFLFWFSVVRVDHLSFFCFFFRISILLFAHFASFSDFRKKECTPASSFTQCSLFCSWIYLACGSVSLWVFFFLLDLLFHSVLLYRFFPFYFGGQLW